MRHLSLVTTPPTGKRKISVAAYPNSQLQMSSHRDSVITDTPLGVIHQHEEEMTNSSAERGFPKTEDHESENSLDFEQQVKREVKESLDHALATFKTKIEEYNSQLKEWLKEEIKGYEGYIKQQTD